jgi:hypothetical protein
MQLRVRVSRLKIVHSTVPKRRYQRARDTSIIEGINFHIADQLSKKAATAVKTFKINKIPESVRQHLSNEFGITKRFVKCSRFIDEFPIARSNQLDQNTRVHINESTFSMKFANTRSRTTIGINGSHKYYSATAICIRFTIMSEHQLTKLRQTSSPSS